MIELFSALKYGTIGLAGILAVLAFSLLKREQNQAEPRAQILQSIYLFMFFSVLLMVAGLLGDSLGASQKQEVLGKLHTISELLDVKMRVEVDNASAETDVTTLRGIIEQLKQNVSATIEIISGREADQQ